MSEASFLQQRMKVYNPSAANTKNGEVLKRQSFR